MAISWGLPKLVSKILEAVPAINYLLNALAKMDYTGTEDVPTGAIRLDSVDGGYQLQRYNGTSWVSVGKLIHDADSVDGKSASTSTTANTIPVRDSSGKIAGDITGNAATATSAAALSTTLAIGKGGTGATSASAARSNLGVPPTSHASSGTTYGLSSATVYGHAMATSDAPAQDTDTGSVGTDVTHFARADHAHQKVLGTSTVYGQVKLTDSVSSTSAASSHIGASAKAVKTAYDKAVDAADAAVPMIGATSSAAGAAGLVPAPAKGVQNRPLRGDGTWATELTCNIRGNVIGNVTGDVTGRASENLPLFGGTMTGQIIRETYLANAGTDDSFLALMGGKTATTGAVLELYGASHSTQKGAFHLRARNGDIYKTLIGTTDGNLTWGGNTIPTIVETWRSGNLFSRRWSDGLKENFGLISSGQTISFHYPYSDNNYKIMTGFNSLSTTIPKYSQLGLGNKQPTYIVGTSDSGISLFFHAFGF